MELRRHWLLLMCVFWLFCAGCKDYSRVHLISDSAEKTIELVEKHKDELAKINVAYEKRTKCSIYGEIDMYLLRYWASPEIMDQWYKIWLESASNSKNAKGKEYLNAISCSALVWFIRAGDWKAVQQLPELTEYPLFEEARRRYLYSSPQGFASWAKEKINENTAPKDNFDAIDYFGLLESAALLVKDFDLAHKAYVMLCNSLIQGRASELLTFAVSNLAFCIDKLGKVTDEDKAILTDYYNKYLKNQKISMVLRKREECILRVLEKYHIVPNISILPDEKTDGR